MMRNTSQPLIHNIINVILKTFACKKTTRLVGAHKQGGHPGIYKGAICHTKSNMYHPVASSILCRVPTTGKLTF